jgi:hypothetical protein
VVNLIMRRPRRVFALYWSVTLLLAGNLLLNQTTTGPRASVHELVTLLTGQTVSLSSAGDALAPSGLIRGSDPEAGMLTVPKGALGAVGAFFDPRLFAPAYLERQGLGDDLVTRVPVFVQFHSRQQAVAALSLGLVDGGVHLTHLFEYLPLAAGYVDKHGPFVPASFPTYLGTSPRTTAHASAPADASGVTGLYLDDTVRLPAAAAAAVGPTLNDAIGLIGADVARRHGLNGKGVTIAIVDTGIDVSHPDLAGRVVAARNFSTDSDVLDHFGHGTHVASIAAGTGAASNGLYGGVAPSASLVNAKALNSSGQGTESGIIQAMEWAADSGAKVINMSLGGGASDGLDPMSQAVNAITQKKGVLFAIAAGNSGPRLKVSTPAAADASIAVAAVDKARNLATFSSRGPRLKDMALKPDIAAPGVAITAARANHGSGDPYATYSGTSMATPMVAGSAALVWQMHPSWTQSQVKDALLSSAAPIGQACAVGAFDQGAGLVNLAAIVAQKAVFAPGSLSFGQITGSASSTTSLANISDASMSLQLRVSLCGQKDDQARVTPTEVKLAPGQSVKVTVTVSGAKKSGPLFGDLQALSGGDPVARAAIGVVVK